MVVAASLAPAFAQAPLDLQAHRGGRGQWPENTLTAFEQAIRLGVTTLELDVSLSLDGVPVVSHDTRLNPAITRDESGAWLSGEQPAVRSLSFARLQQYDVGRINPATSYGRQFAWQQGGDRVRIPALAEVLQRAASLDPRVRFNIETKIDPARPDESGSPEALVHAVLTEIERAGVGARTTVQSFDWRTLALVRSRAPGLARAYLTARRPTFDTLTDGRFTAPLSVHDFASVPLLVRTAAGDGGTVIWSPNFNDLTAELVREAHALELQVIPWTVNQAADMARMIDWGVQGIITDYPERLRSVMRERGIALPAGPP
ncbi:MAG TPA: glycerophosphodiester phosphodiesterase [Burkholderiaceae bacterium]|nr:glycerophosphodiester phosphodiesterase [Burkholderiaceae bacterium]